MTDELKAKVDDFLSRSTDLSLATMDASGKPYAASVAFAHNDARLYFLTSGRTAKIANILTNPHVAFTANVPGKDWLEIQAVQMRGLAEVVEDELENAQALELLGDKFPMFRKVPPSSDLVTVRIQMTEGYVLDYRVAFAHRDPVSY